jgi:predicted ATPase/DNA-binding XRE family transcriptional regulator
MNLTHTARTQSLHLWMRIDVLRSCNHRGCVKPDPKATTRKGGQDMETGRPATRAAFGRLLKRCRQAAGLSQETLAERAGLSWRTISDLERGVKQRPRASTLRLLADALALNAEERAALVTSAYPSDDVVVPPAEPYTEYVASVPTNLPLALTSFVGRERELATVLRLLGETRLLTLTGAGGCGKTRLALEVARSLTHDTSRPVAYTDGIWLIELAALGDGELVTRAVATTLRIRENAGRPLIDSLAAILQPKRVLLLLDNCEHLVTACARLAESLLHVCPRLTILATSREALGIGGERPWRVPSLSLPDPRGPLGGALTFACESVQLFVERAQLARPDFAPAGEQLAQLAQICRRLDGIPLAIELAAARLSVLSLEQLSTRLDDRFLLLSGGSRTALARQQTLRATLDWGYDLLDAPEQLLLRRLSVFVGGWSLEAAEAICASDRLVEEEVLHVLAGLVAKSLVWLEEGTEGARYRLLETVRQYGHEKLVATGEAPHLQNRHLTWYLDLAKQAEPGMGGPEQERWLDRLELELENVRAALAWSCLDEGRHGTGLLLAESLRWFWLLRWHLSEGARWLEGLLNADTAVPLRARSVDALGELVWHQGEPRRALELFEESAVLHRQTGHEASVAHALLAQGMLNVSLGDGQRAAELIEEALPVLRAHGERHGVGWALSSLGLILFLQGEYAQAKTLYHESLSLFQELGDRFGTSCQVVNLANVAQAEGDYGRASHLLRECLIMRRSVADKGGFADCFEGLAVVAMSVQRPSRSARLFGMAEGLREAVELPLQLVGREAHERTALTVRAALGEAAFAAAWAEGQATPLEDAIAYALEVDELNDT